jgi:hypothetical protein
MMVGGLPVDYSIHAQSMLAAVILTVLWIALAIALMFISIGIWRLVAWMVRTLKGIYVSVYAAAPDCHHQNVVGSSSGSGQWQRRPAARAHADDH